MFPVPDLAAPPSPAPGTPAAMPALLEPAVAWEAAIADAVTSHEPVVKALTTALEHAEECDFCEEKDEVLLRDTLAMASTVAENLAKIQAAAKLAVEDEADAAAEDDASISA